DRVQVVGWFRRGITQQIDLESMQTNAAGKVSSYTAFWGKAGGIFVLLGGLALAVVLWLSAST
ncbi:MAG TPA: hypothetical protein VHU80_11495, partial [Polyangiaceae bacterium]|nr:hypothetical protein [Polyangiaceae bacterium]